MNEYQRMAEAHKIELEIKRNGYSYTVFKDIKDRYGEPRGVEEVGEIMGLFQQTGLFYITVDSQSINEAATTHSKGKPMLLCLFDEAKEFDTDCYIVINGTKYRFTALSNVLELNIAINISLEAEIVSNGVMGG